MSKRTYNLPTWDRMAAAVRVVIDSKHGDGTFRMLDAQQNADMTEIVYRVGDSLTHRIQAPTGMVASAAPEVLQHFVLQTFEKENA